MTRALLLLLMVPAKASASDAMLDGMPEGSCKVGGGSCEADEVTLLQSEIKAHKKRRTHVDTIFRQFRTGDESDEGIALAQHARGSAKRQTFSIGEGETKPSMYIVTDGDGTSLKVNIKKGEKLDGSAKSEGAPDIPPMYFSPSGNAVFFELAAGEGGNKCKHPVGVHAKLATEPDALPEKVGGKVSTSANTDGLTTSNAQGTSLKIESEFSEPLEADALLVAGDALVKDVPLEDFLDYVDGEKEIPTDFCREGEVSLSLVQTRRKTRRVLGYAAAAWGVYSWWSR